MPPAHIGVLTDSRQHPTLSEPLAWIPSALRGFGQVSLLPCGDSMIELARAHQVSLVFNTCRAPDVPDEAATIVAQLEDAGVVVTFASAGALKTLARREAFKAGLDSHRLPSPACSVVRPGDDLGPLGRRAFPLAVFGGRHVYRAIDARVVESPAELEAAIAARFAAGDPEVVVERHLVGEMFGCVVLGNGRGRVVLPPVALEAQGPRLEIVPEGLNEGVERLAKATCEAFHLRDGARVDIALSESGVPHIVAVDPWLDVSLNRMNPVLVAAESLGMDEVELVQRCVAAAAERSGLALPGMPAFEDLKYRTPPRGLRLRRS